MVPVGVVIIFLCLSLGIMGIGTFCFMRCLLATVQGIKSKSWPIVEGVINTSSIYEKEDYDSGGVVSELSGTCLE